MKKNIISLTAVLLLAFGAAFSFGQVVSDEARRHYDRGEAAVKARDFEAAIKEFEQAIRLAPDWPDAFYDLGLAQEGAKKYADAVRSYREYLRLAPNAADAEDVKSLINKMEYLAEREKTLTTSDIVEICASLGDGSVWNCSLTRADGTQVPGELEYFAYISGEGGGKLRYRMPYPLL